MSKTSYQSLKSVLEEIRELGDLRYLYTAKREANGDLVYVVDGLPDDAADFRYPGDLIESEIQNELSRALNGEIVLPDKILDTDWGYTFIAYYPLHDESGNVVGALGLEASLLIFRRISNPLYRDIANTDFMSKLKNRNSYETDRDNWKARNALEHLTVVVIDINNLKLANDLLGHDVGDTCIITAGQILHNMESSKVTAYRYGGDEFILLMENHPCPDEMMYQDKQNMKQTE